MARIRQPWPARKKAEARWLAGFVVLHAINPFIIPPISLHKKRRKKANIQTTPSLAPCRIPEHSTRHVPPQRGSQLRLPVYRRDGHQRASLTRRPPRVGLPCERSLSEVQRPCDRDSGRRWSRRLVSRRRKSTMGIRRTWKRPISERMI